MNLSPTQLAQIVEIIPQHKELVTQLGSEDPEDSIAAYQKLLEYAGVVQEQVEATLDHNGVTMDQIASWLRETRTTETMQILCETYYQVKIKGNDNSFDGEENRLRLNFHNAPGYFSDKLRDEMARAKIIQVDGDEFSVTQQGFDMAEDFISARLAEDANKPAAEEIPTETEVRTWEGKVGDETLAIIMFYTRVNAKANKSIKASSLLTSLGWEVGKLNSIFDNSNDISFDPKTGKVSVTGDGEFRAQRDITALRKNSEKEAEITQLRSEIQTLKTEIEEDKAFPWLSKREIENHFKEDEFKAIVILASNYSGDCDGVYEKQVFLNILKTYQMDEPEDMFDKLVQTGWIQDFQKDCFNLTTTGVNTAKRTIKSLCGY